MIRQMMQFEHNKEEQNDVKSQDDQAKRSHGFSGSEDNRFGNFINLGLGGRRLSHDGQSDSSMASETLSGLGSDSNDQESDKNIKGLFIGVEELDSEDNQKKPKKIDHRNDFRESLVNDNLLFENESQEEKKTK